MFGSGLRRNAGSCVTDVASSHTLITAWERQQRVLTVYLSEVQVASAVRAWSKGEKAERDEQREKGGSRNMQREPTLKEKSHLQQRFPISPSDEEEDENWEKGQDLRARRAAGSRPASGLLLWTQGFQARIWLTPSVGWGFESKPQNLPKGAAHPVSA